MKYVKPFSLFSFLFPTRLTDLGHQLFFITDEDDYVARLTRIDRIHMLEIDPERATRGTL